MAAHFRRSSLVVLLAMTGLLSCQAGKAQAHPQLAGKWVAPVPPGGFMAFQFGAGFYLGDGVWRGPYLFIASGCPVAWGVYELKMFTGTEGTLALRSGLSAPGWTVGNVDLAVPEVTYMNATYKR